MAPERVAGFTSTGSKRPEALFGSGEGPFPLRMVRSSGCRVWDEEGREYLDYVMALGAVALGYGHPAVSAAAKAAVEAGVVGPLPPLLEEEVADALCRLLPWVERVRFLKSGAEAVAAAVRLARVFTGREQVLGCGYHGWLDWCEGSEGVPSATRALYGEIPFNDAEQTRELIARAGSRLAAVVVEPVVVEEPKSEWLAVVRQETRRAGALLVLDEIKTAFRIALGGGAERYHLEPDLMVVGKAMANGFPLAAVGGRREVMDGVTRTWISSTLSTEFVSLAAARATLEVMVRERVPEHLHRVGTRLYQGLVGLQARHPDLIGGVGGIPEMCFLRTTNDEVSRGLARGAAARGVLFKRTAFNFVSLAHDEAAVAWTLSLLEQVFSEMATQGIGRG